MMKKVKHFELRMVSEKTHNLPGEWVQNVHQASAIATHLIGDRPVEHLIAILLDGRSRVTGVSTIAIGGLHGCGVSMRDVMRIVLTSHAAGFVLAHNHPSGSPEPSDQDVEFTKKVAEAAEICGTTLLDHLVVTADGSFRSIDVR